MGLSNIFNSIKGGIGKASGSLSDLFSNKISYEREPSQTASVAQAIPRPAPKTPKGSVNPEKITSAIRQLESSGGLDPNTPRGQKRTYITVPANGSEQARTINYNVGFGGEYGLTPVALAEMAGSRIDYDADPSTFTKYGRPLLPGMRPEDIQRELMTPEGAGRLANKFFMMKRKNKEDYTPESLANDYVDFYVGKAGVSDTAANRKRALDYFYSIID